MKCDRCENALKADDKYSFYGRTLCEDCYITAMQRPVSCDPLSVSSARNTRRQLGQTGTSGLTALQKKIYEYVKEKEKVESAEFMKAFGLSQWEMETQFSVLRHCELLRGCKEGNKVYITTF